MKKIIILSITLILLFMITVMPVSAFSGSGSGTETSPYLITTAAQLNEVRNGLSAYYKLGADINLNSVAWVPIGNYTSESENQPFSGVFDGNGKTISNLNIDTLSSNYVGLFGYVYDESGAAIIKNLNLVNTSVKGKDYVGGLAGCVKFTTISNCCADGRVTSTLESHYIGGLIGCADSYTEISGCSSDTEVLNGYYAGGLVGQITGHTSIDNCFTTGVTNGQRYVGGLVGLVKKDTRITNSYASGNVNGISGNSNGDKTVIGGLAGYVEEATITSCYSAGNVVGYNTVGGFVGYLTGSDSVRIVTENCYSIGNVTAAENVGGLVGDARSASITNCNSSGHITINGEGNVGGLVGYAIGVLITSCDSASDISGSSTKNNGGLVGFFDGISTIDNCHASGDVNTPNVNGVGGLIGGFGCYNRYHNTASVINSTATGDVTGSNNVGGLIGSLNGHQTITNVINCSASGDVTGSYNKLGGFIGELVADTSESSNNQKIIIQKCHASGDVNGSSDSSYRAGGLIGDICTGECIISGCYASGDVSGAGRLGGLIGYSERNYYSRCTISILNSYASGDVTGSSKNLGYENVGGLIGEIKYPSYIQNCYASGNVKSNSVSGNVGGLVGRENYGSISKSVALNANLFSMKNIARIVGSVENAEISNNYALDSMQLKLIRNVITPVTNNYNGTGVSIASAKTKSFYTGLEWDFNNVWKMDTNISQYPVFIWQNKEVIPVTTVTNTTTSVNASTPAKIGYELSPSLLDTVQPPTFTHGANTIILNETVVVKKFVGGVETEVPATVNSDGTVQVNEDIDDADYITVTFVGRKIGDASGDGEVSVRDSVVISRYLAVLDPLDTTGQFYANLDGRSNGVKVIDCIKIARYKAGILDSNFEVNVIL